MSRLVRLWHFVRKVLCVLFGLREQDLVCVELYLYRLARRRRRAPLTG